MAAETTTQVTEEYKNLYPLHAAVIQNDATAASKAIQAVKGQKPSDVVRAGSAELMRRYNKRETQEEEDLDLFINHRDWRGNPALHLATHFRHHEMVKMLLKEGADPMMRNGGGFSAVQEAICSGDMELAELLSDAVAKSASDEYQNRMPKILEQLEKSPDFSCELKWEFKSWVPLLSRMLPNDVYRMYKCGSSFRIDATLVGYSALRCQRGNISFHLAGMDTKEPGRFTLVDHEKKIYDIVDPNEDTKPKNVKDLLDRPKIHRVQFQTNDVSFTPAKTFWGYERTERVAGFDTRVYDANHLDLMMLKRVRSKEVALPPPTLHPDYFKEAVKEGKGNGLPYSTETVKNTVKSFNGTVHMTDSFPYEIKDILPILEVIAPRAKHFARLKEFIELKLPEGQFPVRMELPVITTISAAVTFLNFQRERPNPDMFTIPSDYSSGKVHFNFDFTKKEEAEGEKAKQHE
ncbi:hypothetical protein PROFUN_07066 [Planoprotostelium fungivorum]|uniref:Ankyrin repeat domain-containing protein n=1 Tax=Planoprotostelium fungivorum TaxID=1890364 RepID=A0A2P6NN82_9EUKA|nr:hypothetical protein PROFUN_15951 [Planoprotostelium fungivorum]PRP85358.1 hypothetical protein PROFUN_07066 [Planoprotostelium fungivorum]